MHTSYAALYFLLIFTGAIIFFAGHSVQADQSVSGSVTVSGRMKGPVPPNPAVVVEPSGGTRVTTNSTVIRGTCDPGLYIELFRYSVFAGSTLCSNSGEFQLSATLKPGQNDFIVRMSDADAQYAPDSNTLTIFYDVPKKKIIPGATATNPNDPSSQNQNNPPGYDPLIVTTSLPRNAFPINKKETINYRIIGGKGPYAILVDWDDGAPNDLLSVSQNGDNSVTHKFTKSGQNIITITVSDALNNKASVQTIISVTRDYTGAASVISPQCVPGTSAFYSTECYVESKVAQILDSAWPAVLVAGLMTTSFWLGERVVSASTANRSPRITK